MDTQPFWFLTLGLTLFGLLMVYSSSFIFAVERGGDGFLFIRKQLIFAGLGLLSMWLFSRIHFQIWLKTAYISLLLALILLVMVYIPGLGTKVGGAQRWIGLGEGLRFQPVELAKVAVVIFVARHLYLKAERLHSFTASVVGTLLLISPLMLLTLFQPDLGSVVVMSVVVFIMMFLAGVPWYYLTGLLVTGLSFFAAAIFSSDYRMQRFQAFLNPWNDPSGSGFQILQSYLGLSQGQWTGVGLGNGKSKLFFLPEAHNDFIFAVIGEELGFLGSSLLVIIYFLFIIQGLKLVYQGYRRHQHGFALLLGTGLIVLLAVQGLVNMGVVLGLLPTKGLGLPLISYGGTALLIQLTLLGIVLSTVRGQSNSLLGRQQST